MSEHDHEPVRGLPAHLPPGERMLWQGSPDWRHLFLNALHVRLVALYFVAMTIWGVAQGQVLSAVVALVAGVVVLGLFALFAWGVARTATYTLTDKRLVMRVGVALDACINLPLKEIESADLKMLGSRHGTIVLKLKGAPRLGYWMLWPHARSLRIVRPQPMLRGIPEAAKVAEMLFYATQKHQTVAPAGSGEISDRPAGALAGAHA